MGDRRARALRGGSGSKERGRAAHLRASVEAVGDDVRTLAEHACVLASRESAARPCSSRLVRHSNGDVVVRDAYLPADLVPGDLVAVATGALLHLDGQATTGSAPPVVAVGGTARAGDMLRHKTAPTCWH